MTVVRANIIASTQARDKYISAVTLLKAERIADGLSSYDAFVIWHYQAMKSGSGDLAHRGPVFLPFHRYVLLVLERHMQRVLNDLSFGIPYWNWCVDAGRPPKDQQNAPIWSVAYMGGDGGRGGPVVDGPFAFHPDGSGFNVVRVETGGKLETAKRGLFRHLGYSRFALPTYDDVRAAIAASSYDEPPWNTASYSFRNLIEGWKTEDDGIHNGVHNWIGGDMMKNTSPNDPVFYLLHANIDRIWRAWQQKHGRLNYAPDDHAGDNLKGHRIGDRLSSMVDDPPPLTIREMLDVDGLYTYDTLADFL